MKYLIRLKSNLIPLYKYSSFLFPNPWEYTKVFDYYKEPPRDNLYITDIYKYFDKTHISLFKNKFTYPFIDYISFCGSLSQVFFLMRVIDNLPVIKEIIYYMTFGIPYLIKDGHYKKFRIFMLPVKLFYNWSFDFLITYALRRPPNFLKILIPIISKSIRKTRNNLYFVDNRQTKQIVIKSLHTSFYISKINIESLKLFQKMCNE